MDIIRDILGTEDEPVLHSVSEAKSAWNVLSNNAEPPAASVQHRQKPVYDRLLEKSKSSIPVAHIQGTSSPGSGDWLQAVSSSTLGLRLDDTVPDIHRSAVVRPYLF